jgi:hypothetical protein
MLIPKPENCFLSPEDERLFLSLEEALRGLAQSMEARLPADIKQAHWVKHNTSPAPWAEIYHEHRSVPCDEELLATLSARMMIAEILEKLNTERALLEAVGKPIGSLKLAKVRRV